jgi:N-acetylglucosaminyldiphosphoundecaprenol N-acetyl-beta-D-mannosaminyltransferase
MAEYNDARIEFMKVPIDSIEPESLEARIKSFMLDGESHQIILLSLWDLMRIRRNAEWRAMASKASLVIPISKSVQNGVRFLKLGAVRRYEPFDFIIKLLGCLEKLKGSVYLLGSSKKTILAAERNVRQTFPGLQVVGRYSGFYHKSVEPKVLEAIRKAGPSLLMVGRGVQGRERWLARKGAKLPPCIRLWSSDCFEVFADARRRASPALFNRGLEFLAVIARRPWKLYRLFIYAYYKTLLLGYRIFKK